VCPPEESLPTTADTDPFRGQVPLIRPAAITDVPQIHHLLDTYANMGNVLPRPFSELYRHLRDFFVIELDGRLVACGALEIFTENLGEVRSLVVAEEYKKHGLGRRLVARIVDEARQIGLRRVMALTYVPRFFHNMGFRTVAKETLPEKVWGICVKCYKFNHCDETAVLLELW
jgi:amino-acid N-acetyltransferase